MPETFNLNGSPAPEAPKATPQMPQAPVTPVPPKPATPATPQMPLEPINKIKNTKVYLIAGIVGLLVIVGIFVAYKLMAGGSEETQVPQTENTLINPSATVPSTEETQAENNIVNELQDTYPPSSTEQETIPATTETETTLPKIERGTQQTASIAENCNTFPDKLDSCLPYKCQFQHQLTGQTLIKEITGLNGDKCSYSEQMPNNGNMECQYTENMRKAVAQYYKNMASAESVGTSVNINLGSGEQKTKYTIDGKEVENPLQEAMDTGQCVVSGY